MRCVSSASVLRRPRSPELRQARPTLEAPGVLEVRLFGGKLHRASRVAASQFEPGAGQVTRRSRPAHRSKKTIFE